MRRRFRHPLNALDAYWEHSPPRIRIDRNAGNMCMLIGLMFPTFAIVLVGPVPNSAIGEMPEWLQLWMCAAIFFGCGIKLHGALSGSKFWFPNTKLKTSYTYGFIGAPLATSGLLVYGYYILSSTPNFVAALSGILTPMLGLGIGIQAVYYWLEYRRLERAEERFITQAKRILEDDSDTMG